MTETNKLRILKHFAGMNQVPDIAFEQAISASLELESKWGLPSQEILAVNPTSVDLVWNDVSLAIPFDPNGLFQIHKYKLKNTLVFVTNSFYRVLEELKELK